MIAFTDTDDRMMSVSLPAQPDGFERKTIITKDTSAMILVPSTFWKILFDLLTAESFIWTITTVTKDYPYYLVPRSFAINGHVSGFCALDQLLKPG